MTPKMEALRQALLGRQVGSRVTIDTVRAELEAAGVQPYEFGGLFLGARHRGWLKETGSAPAAARSRKGGRVLTYRRLPIGAQGRGKHRDRRQPELPLEGD